MFLARGEAQRNPGLGMLHKEPSANEFSEMRLSIFRTEGSNKDEKLCGCPFIVFRVFSGFRLDQRASLNIHEVPGLD